MIDNVTLLVYPVHIHEHLYIQYGAWTKKLVLNRIKNASLDSLIYLQKYVNPGQMFFKSFPKITHLTIRGSELGRINAQSITLSFFKSLTKLYLINNTVSDQLYFLTQDFFQNYTLEHLYLEKNNWLTIPNIPKLHTLSVIDQCVSHHDFRGCLLKNLTLTHCWVVGNHLGYGYQEYNQAFSYENVKRFKILEHLRIIRPVSLQQREQIEALNLPSTDFFSYEIPQEENLILRLLNDDCIRHLGTFLAKTEDLISLYHTHSRFLVLNVPEYKIEEKTLNRIPVEDNMDSYNVICPLVKKLSIVSFAEDVLPLMLLFVRLEELHLSTYELSPYEYEADFHDVIENIRSGLRKLSISGYVTNLRLHSFFQRISSTLEVLDMKTNYPNHEDFFSCEDYNNTMIEVDVIGLDELSNVKEFKCEDLGISYEFKRFFGRCQDTMTHLDIGLRWHHGVWNCLKAMKNLKSLKVCIEENIYRDDSILQIAHSETESDFVLPMLEKLVIVHKRLQMAEYYRCDRWFYEEYKSDTYTDGYVMLSNFLQSLDGNKLRKFQLHADSIETSIFKKMTNLVELSIVRPIVGWSEFIQNMLSLTNLEMLTANYLTESEMLSLIRALLKLRDITSSSTYNKKDEYHPQTINKVLEYLRQDRRNLLLNGNMLA